MSLIPLKRNKQEWTHENNSYDFPNENIYMRPATEDDIDNMYQWEMESIDKSLQEDPKVQSLIRQDCYDSLKDTQMIMDDDKTIGMYTACMIDNGEWRYIGEIYIIPEYRGQHIGSTILKNEIANYDRIRLQVAYDNEGALRLYKSLGFKIVKENKEAKLYIMEYDKAKQISEGFVDRTIKHTLAGLKIPKLQPVDEKYLMDHKADYMKLYQDRGTITSSYYNLHYDTFKKTFGDKAKELYDALENLFAHIGFAKDFNIYNKYRLFLCKLLNMPINHVIALEGWYNRADMGQMRVKSKEDDEGIPLKSTDVLYHTSKIKGLTELQPTFVSRNSQDPFDFGKKLLSIEALYTSPRVYVGLNEPVGREGLGIGGLRIYKITNFKGKVKYDHELTGGAARFIETRSPVKVVDITEEYIKAHQIQEAMNGVNASPVDDNFFIEAVLKAKDRNALKDSEFGIPELRKYPLTDETHINMAVKFFGKAPKKYKLSLAKRILRSAHSHDMDTDGWDTINDYIKNHKESTVTEGFVDKNIKYTLAGIKIPKLGPVDEKYLMDHKSDYAQLKNSGYIDLHDNNFQRLFNDKADELYEPLDNLFQHIGYAKDFNIYNKYRLLLCKLFDLPTNHVIGLEGFYSGNLGQLRLKEEEDSNGTPLKPNDVLYHTSKHKGITELQPSFVSRKTKTIRRMPGQNLLSIEALYTTPRVYVGLNTPVSRLGGHGSVSISDDTRIYKIIGFKGSVKEDKELHGAARFIETKSPVKVVDVTDEYLSKHIKESVVQEAAYKKGINKANVHPVMIVYKRFSTKKKAQLVPIGKMWDIANKYFPNSTDLSGFGWDWTGWETDFAYGIIINNKQIPDGFMDELKKEFPDIKLDKNFLIPKTYEETYDCTESNMNEVYDKIWAKGFLECELEEYPAEGKMKISVIYQKDKAKLENEVSKHIKEASTIQEGFFEVGFGNLRKTIADKLGKFVTVTNVQNPTGKEAKFVIKSNEHPEDYVNVIAMGNGVKAYGYKDSERVSIFNNASLSAAIQKLIDSVCDLFDIQKPINESYTERKNFIMKEQITKILEAYNSGVLTQEEASTKIESIQESYTPNSDAEKNKAEEVMESTTMNNLRVKQDKIMESFKMGIINATEGMRLIERVMMEADYITEEEDTAYEGDDDNEPEDITPEDTDGDTVDSDDTNIDALADYINSLSDDEKTALMSKLSGSDEPTDDDANGNEEVPTDDATPAEGEPTTEETVDPASVSDASLNDANASLDDMEV